MTWERSRSTTSIPGRSGAFNPGRSVGWHPHTTAPPSYTGGTKESVGLQLVRMVLASDVDEMRDLRAQRGVGADTVDQLDRVFELKVYAGVEPDVIRLEESQFRRAMSTPDFSSSSSPMWKARTQDRRCGSLQNPSDSSQ
jgi:hypothetical protein